MLDDIITKYGYDLAERPSRRFHYCCPSCGTFYSEETIPKVDFVWDEDCDRFREISYCNCHNKNTILVDCYENGSFSPAMKWEAEVLKLIQHRLQGELDVVEKELKNYEEKY